MYVHIIYAHYIHSTVHTSITLNQFVILSLLWIQVSQSQTLWSVSLGHAYWTCTGIYRMRQLALFSRNQLHSSHACTELWLTSADFSSPTFLNFSQCLTLQSRLGCNTALYKSSYYYYYYYYYYYCYCCCCSCCCCDYYYYYYYYCYCYCCCCCCYYYYYYYYYFLPEVHMIPQMIQKLSEDRI